MTDERTMRIGYRQPRRRRTGWTILAVIVALLIVITVVGDRVAASYATRELRAQLVAELTDRGVQAQRIDVTIGGFPFLTQVAEGRYDEIRIDLAEVRIADEAGRQAALPELRIVATGVLADTAEVVRGTATVTAERVTGTAVVSFDTLQHLVDYSEYNLSGVTFTESTGGLKLTGRTTFGGLDIPISATVDIAITAGQLQVRLRDAEAVNTPLPQAAENYLTELAEQSISGRLPQLPYRLALDEVTVRPDGLLIRATAHDVPLVG